MTFDLANVSLSYRSRARAATSIFHDLNLSIKQGECVGILGPEGAGKTTLLQCMAGLLKPDTGRVFIDALDIWNDSNAFRQVRRQLGFAFQFPEQQFFCETVERELMYARSNFGLGNDADSMAPSEVLDALGVSGKCLHRSPFSLSLGEARRVALATLLMTKPRALLLDEPTVGLDGAGVEVVLGLLRRMRKEKQTVVVVSHDVDMLAEVASRIVILADGQIQADGPAQSILVNDELLADHGYVPPEVVSITREIRHGTPGFLRFDEARAFCNLHGRGDG